MRTALCAMRLLFGEVAAWEKRRKMYFNIKCLKNAAKICYKGIHTVPGHLV